MTLRVAVCALLAIAVVATIDAAGAGASMSAETRFGLSPFQAGGHPDVELTFDMTNASGETLKSVAYLPSPGFTLEPASLASCANTTFANGQCSPDAQLGIVTVRGTHEGDANYLLGTAPFYNLSALPRQFARIGFLTPTTGEPVIGVMSLPTEPQPPATDAYQMRLTFDQLSQATALSHFHMTIWGVPASSSHDADRFAQGSAGCPGSETTSCDTPTSSSLPEASLTLSAFYCVPGSSTINWTPAKVYTTYEGFESTTFEIRRTNGHCATVGFNPSLSAAPTTSAGYSPAGLDVTVTDPQPQTPGTVSPSELQSANVTVRGAVLDPKLSEHPVCEDSAAAITANRPSACPAASKIGTATLDVKGLSEPIPGEIFLGNTVAGRVRIFVVAPSNGLELKLLGLLDRLIPDGVKLSFGDQPRLPIAEEAFHFSPSFVRTPIHCGIYAVEGTLAAWDPNQLTEEPEPSYSITTGPGGSACIGAPASVAVQLSPSSIAADGSSQTTATITVSDAEGQGVPAEKPELSSTDPLQKIAAPTDNGDGTYSAVITGSTTVGASTITATDPSQNPPISGTAELVQTEVAHQQPPSSEPPAPPPAAPRVRFLKKPARRGTKRRASFDFAADVPGATFSCSLDHQGFSPCTPPLVLRNLSLGSHTFSVRATNGSAVGATSSWRFQVLRAHRRAKRRGRGGHHRGQPPRVSPGPGS